jgi:predicted SAM-dependent methyltransferase
VKYITKPEDFKFIKTRHDIPKLLENIGAENICEIGVAEGDNFRRLLLASTIKKAVAIDIWKITEIQSQHDYPLTQEHKNNCFNDMTNLSSIDSRVQVIRDFSLNACQQFKDNYFDFVYIDADHSEDAVYADLCEWYPKVRPGGVLAGHDYFDLITETGVKFGIIEALNRFVKENNLPIYTDEVGWYDWFIAKPLEKSNIVKYKELLIGCGNNKRKQITHFNCPVAWQNLTTLDINAYHNPDIIWHLENKNIKLPFGSNSFDEIHAYDILEHLGSQGNYRFFLNEFEDYWRILKPNGMFFGKCPMWNSPSAWGDISHKRTIQKENLEYLNQMHYKSIKETSFIDFRNIYDGDFELEWNTESPETFYFILKAIKPARK